MPTTTDHPPTYDPDHLAVYLGLVHGLTPAQIDGALGVLEATVELMRISAQTAVDRLTVAQMTAGVRR